MSFDNRETGNLRTDNPGSEYDMADPSWAQGVNDYYGAKSDTGTSAAPPA